MTPATAVAGKNTKNVAGSIVNLSPKNPTLCPQSNPLPSKKYPMTYQFLIRIQGYTKPEVWRRIEAPSHYSFFWLHKVITIAFSKPHENIIYMFSESLKKPIKGIWSIQKPFSDELFAKTTLLSSVFKRSGQTYFYKSDFNEQLLHQIVLEKITGKDIPYAVCLAGEGAFPPETCADPDDYDEMKQALSDKDDPQHQTVREWLELAENETWEEKYKLDVSKVNEQLKHIEANILSFRDYIIVEHDAFNEKYGLTPALWSILDKYRSDIGNKHNLSLAILELRKLVNKYPAIPHFKNSLASAYLANKQKEQYYEIVQQIIPAFPDYTMSRCGLAHQYLSAKQPDKASELLGKNLDLNELYPGRNRQFMELEVIHYHTAVVFYLMKTNNLPEAQKHFEYIENLSPFSVNIHELRQNMLLLTLEFFKDNPRKVKTVEVIAEQVEHADKMPDFENPVIIRLYLHRDMIAREDIRLLMALPRESLIRDLEKVLIDSIARFDYFKDTAEKYKTDAPFHALYLLSALQAEEALDTLFTVMRQDKDYYNFWFGDVLTEEFWQFIYNMGQNRSDRLLDFIKEPNRYKYIRTSIDFTMKQIAFRQQERKEEVVSWFVEALQYMLDHQNDDGIFDSTVYKFLFGDLLRVAEKKHLPVILPLYDEQLVETPDRYSLHQIKKYIVEPDIDITNHAVSTTFDQLFDVWLKWYKPANNARQNQKKSTEKTAKSKPVDASNKSGRNDPCPCGSGKKYKKCCGLNNVTDG